ncbi:ABC transporter substrate-binding protein [Nesterenkonia muleiensis]|uniref:ABC transporter substrate-binding protein n=1 Tax=Nesterenkonia muleiensis TaxID=2282648 RepID=UPI000E709C94|nr:sugar ABC transporter substrate-binding protein [Nesterenkonia muleiensis]
MNRALRRKAIISAAAAASLVLTACGGAGQQEASTQEPVELRFAFWGSDTRVQNTQRIIDEFNTEHPDIDVEIEYSDWGGFWDQLNTQIAGGTPPDIFQMDAPYLREYGERGSLLDLSGVDLAHIPEEIVESGTIDGEYYGLASGVNAVAVVANPRLFDEAGVEMPDDTTWTWDDWAQTALEIAEELDGVYGSSGIQQPQLIQAWLRQQGLFFNDDQGQLGFGQEDLEEFFEWVDELHADGVIPPAAVMVEEESASQDQSLEATGQAAMAFTWTNLLGALTDAGGEDLTLLRLPSSTGTAEDAQQWYNTGMVAASSATEHPEEVTTFLDFFVNDERSALINMTDRGLSANTEIRGTLMEEMDEANQEAADFITTIESELGPPEPVPATGFGNVADIMGRYQQQILFEQLSPQDAAEAAYPELESEIGG